MGDYNDQNDYSQMNGNNDPSQNQQPQNDQYQNQQPQNDQFQNQQPQNDQYQNQQQQNGQYQYQQPQNNPYQYQQPQYDGQSQYQQNDNQQYQSSYQQYQQYQQPRQKSDNGMAVGALVCGIVSLLFSCCLGFVSLITGIVSVVLAILFLKKHNDPIDKNGRTMAIIAIVLAALGILSGIISIIGCSVLVNDQNFWNEIYGSYNSGF